MSKEIVNKSIFDRFYEYCIKRINCEKITEVDHNGSGSLAELLNIKQLFCFLLRYENKDFYKKEDWINAAFKGYICSGVCHVGTDYYERLLRDKPELKKLVDNEPYEIVSNERFNYFEESTVYIKSGNILTTYDKIIQKPFVINYKQLAEISPQMYFRFRNTLPSNRITKEGIRIPKKDVETTFKDIGYDDLLFQKNGNKYFLVAELKYDNIFKDGIYKLYNSKGEVVENPGISFKTIIKKIRNSVAHTQLKEYVLETKQRVVVFKLNKDKQVNIQENLTIVIDAYWFLNLCIMYALGDSKNYRFVYNPQIVEEIKTKEDFDLFLTKSKLLNIKFEEAEDTAKPAFKSMVSKLVSQFNNDKKIKLSIEEYLTKNLSKFYTNVEISSADIQDIPDLWFRFSNKIAKEKAGMFNDKRYLEYQNYFLHAYLNYYFIDVVNNVDKDGFRVLNNTVVIDIINTYYNAFYGRVKDKLNYRMGFEIEDLVSICQFLIFEKLINNTLYEDMKKVYLFYRDNKRRKSIVDIEYLNSEEGKLRTAINGLDMSKFEIISTRGKTQPRPAESLGDKLLVIRLLRNSISHNGFAYQLANTKQVFDTYLRLSSHDNPFLQLRVRIKDLLNLLNQDFFNYDKNDSLIGNNKKVTIKELEDIAKSMCAIEDDDDDNIDLE